MLVVVGDIKHRPAFPKLEICIMRSYPIKSRALFNNEKLCIVSSACSSLGVTCGQTRSQALLFCVRVFSKLFRYAEYFSQNVNYSFLENPSIL
jgi:hypothetical protein